MPADPMNKLVRGPGILAALLVAALSPGCGGGSEAEFCGGCLPTQHCDELSGICVEPGPAGLDGTDLAPRLAGTWQNGNPAVLAYDRIGKRFLYGSDSGSGESWETAALVDASVPPPGGPQIALVGLTPEPVFLVETAPGELSILRREDGAWTAGPAGVMPGPLTGLSSVPDTGQTFRACAGDVDGNLWFTFGNKGAISWLQVEAKGLPGLPSAPCALARAGGQPVLLAALRPAGLVSMWQDEDESWQFSVIDAETVPVALSVAPAETGLAAAWIDGTTGELRVARGTESGIEVAAAAAASSDLASACAVSLATSANGMMRLVFRNAQSGQLVLLGPQPVGPGWELLAALPQEAPLLPLLGFTSSGVAAVVGIQFSAAGIPGAGTYRRIDF